MIQNSKTLSVCIIENCHLKSSLKFALEYPGMHRGLGEGNQ